MKRQHVSLLIAVLIGTTRANAQQLWPTDHRGNEVSVALGHLFSEAGTEKVTSFFGDVLGRVHAGRDLVIEAEVPVSYFHESPSAGFSSNGPTTSARVGNPWLGVNYRVKPGINLVGGVRPGLESDVGDEDASFGAIVYGAYGDFDHSEAWAAKTTSVRALVQLGSVPEWGPYGVGYAGMTVALPRSGNEKTYLADYGLQVGYRGRSVSGTLSISGRLDIGSHKHFDGTPISESFEERNVNQAALGIERSTGRFRPKVIFRIFLDPSLRESRQSDGTGGAGLHGVLSVGASWLLR